MEVYKQIKSDIFWILLLLVLIVIVSNHFRVGFDSTDGESRSGLGLYTDAMTGCQYLSSGGSGITPRLDRDGRHICEETP